MHAGTTVWIGVLLSASTLLAARSTGQPLEGGARIAALGGAATALGGEIWGHANPATWSTLENRAVAFFASEGYGLRQLRVGAFQYAEPLAPVTLALGVRTFGFDDFSETFLDVGAARGFHLGSARRVHVGVLVRYHRVRITDYGGAGALGLSAGGLVRLVPVLVFGVHLANVNAPSYGHGEDLPRSLAMGLQYAADDRVRLLMDVVQDVRFPLSVRAGIEATPVRAVALRAGMATSPLRFSAGAGFRLGPLAADVAAERHEVLGWTPALAFALHW